LYENKRKKEIRVFSIPLGVAVLGMHMGIVLILSSRSAGMVGYKSMVEWGQEFPGYFQHY
jgi:uncharacterized membrane protein YjfL (UPF0719 family)